MKLFKGTIALDIDGTLTVGNEPIPREVLNFLSQLSSEGWSLCFVTGRTFAFASPLFKELQESYFLAVQNGAALFKMPEETLCAKHYLPINDLPFLSSLFKKEKRSLLIESGKTNQDVYYYFSTDVPLAETEYLSFRMSLSAERWEAVNSPDFLSIQEFAAGKFFAEQKLAESLAYRIQEERRQLCRVTVIRDPFRPGYYLGHITHNHATKGNILGEVIREGSPLIVAGDDYNDIAMIKRGNIKIVMGNAPEEMHGLGDIIAPPAAERGIIPALEQAIQRI